jgi:hypothetical protein
MPMRNALSAPWGVFAACALYACASSTSSETAAENGSSSEATAMQLQSKCMPITAPSCVLPPPSFANDVTPILNRDCNTCHVTNSTLWPLSNYDDVYDWTNLLVPDIEGCLMPPQDAGPEAGTLSPADQQTLMKWFACNAPNN